MCACGWSGSRSLTNTLTIIHIFNVERAGKNAEQFDLILLFDSYDGQWHGRAGRMGECSEHEGGDVVCTHYFRRYRLHCSAIIEHKTHCWRIIEMEIGEMILDVSCIPCEYWFHWVEFAIYNYLYSRILEDNSTVIKIEWARTENYFLTLTHISVVLHIQFMHSTVYFFELQSFCQQKLSILPLSHRIASIIFDVVSVPKKYICTLTCTCIAHNSRCYLILLPFDARWRNVWSRILNLDWRRLLWQQYIFITHINKHAYSIICTASGQMNFAGIRNHGRMCSLPAMVSIRSRKPATLNNRSI